MKLQRAVIAIVLGVIAFIAYMMMNREHIKWSKYILELSGLFLVLGALLFLYPVLLGRKDKEGCVELDPEAPVETADPVDK